MGQDGGSQGDCTVCADGRRTVSFAPFHHPTFSECQRACQLVDPATPTTQMHRSSEARTNLARLSLYDEDIAPAVAPETAYE